VLRGLAALIAPPLCAVCGESCEASETVCDACGGQIAAHSPLLLTIPGAEAGWAAVPYSDAPRRLVTALKFGKRLGLAAVAAEAMAAAAPAEAIAIGALVPVPADPWRRRIRGFDPAREIAGALSRRLELPLSPCLIRRHGPRQTGRPRVERLASLPRVEVVDPVPPTAILIDDVVTTGATLAACAGALRQAGSERVLALAFARA